jgi:multiple sugar transport system substrate-binding protein
VQVAAPAQRDGAGADAAQQQGDPRQVTLIVARQNGPAPIMLTDDVDPALNAPFKIDGKTYYIPHSWNNMVIYYNTKMFKDAGIDPPKPDWSWDDFLGIAKKLTTGSGADQVFGFGIPNFNFGLQPWLLTSGTTQLNADWTDSNLNDPKVVESITFVHDLVHVHKVSPAVEGSNNDQLFAAGKMAMGGWAIGRSRAS